jgi:ribosomal protein S7
MIKKKINKNTFFLKRLSSLLLKDGKLSVSNKILNRLMYSLKFNDKLVNKDIVNFINSVLKQISLDFTIKTRKKGKIREQIPVKLMNPEKIEINTFRFLLKILRKQKNKNFQEKILGEFIDVLEGRGQLRKEKLAFDKLVNDNRKFIRKKWD